MRQARDALEETIIAIRLVPGYTDFLLDPTYEKITRAALPDVPLLYITTTSVGSMALLVTASGNEPEVIRADDFKVKHLLLTKYQEGQLVGGYLPGQVVPAWMRNTLTASLPVVGSDLVQHIAQRLHERKVTRVVLIPTGSLGMIPFHAAPYWLEGREVRLLEHFDIAYTPSARVLLAARYEARRRGTHLASAPQHLVGVGVGNPLPDVRVEGEAKDEIQRMPPVLDYVRLEMECIESLFSPGDVTTLYGSEATKQALWDALPEASIVHLSCHASFHADSPLDSAFLLAQETRLTLRDLLEADGQRLALLQLAVLSACQTAVTDVQELPDEATGLFAGFLHTGVPAVVGTLWSVDQISTTLLMIRFYDLYLYGDPQIGLWPRQPLTALGRAQCWLRDLSNNALLAYLDEQAQRNRYQISNLLRPNVYSAIQKGEGGMLPYAHPYHRAAFVYYGAS